MTPETRAARDRVSAFATARDDHRLPHEPQPETLACIWQDGTPVKLQREDLRLLLAALDEHETAAGALPAGEPYRVTMRLASDGFPFPHDTQHPPACDLLRYGQHCQFDQLLDEGHAFPDAPGVFTARIILAREPEPGDAYAEGPEIHYERIGDAP